MLRVMKLEVSKEMPVENDGLKICLDLWVKLISRDDLGIGWRGRTVLLESSASADSQQLYDRSDDTAAKAVAACIDSLPRHYDWAIGRSCGINKVWRYPKIDYFETLQEAQDLLITKLKKNHDTQIYFR